MDRHASVRVCLSVMSVCTVLAESNRVGHDGTSYAVLKRVEVEF